MILMFISLLEGTPLIVGFNLYSLLVSISPCATWRKHPQVGWIPNYLRHVVAQMLIEYLDISWKRGLDALLMEKNAGVIQENGEFNQHKC